VVFNILALCALLLPAPTVHLCHFEHAHIDNLTFRGRTLDLRPGHCSHDHTQDETPDAPEASTPAADGEFVLWLMASQQPRPSAVSVPFAPLPVGIQFSDVLGDIPSNDPRAPPLARRLALNCSYLL